MIKQEIQNAIIVALKMGKQIDLKALRFVLSQINYEEIAKQKELTDEEVISLLRKEIKKRKEATELFKKGEREDLVTDEEAQIVVIQKFLPQQLSEEELGKIIDDVIASVGEEKNIGKIIGLVMGKVKGKADGPVVSSLVRQKLTLMSS